MHKLMPLPRLDNALTLSVYGATISLQLNSDASYDDRLEAAQGWRDSGALDVARA